VGKGGRERGAFAHPKERRYRRPHVSKGRGGKRYHGSTILKEGCEPYYIEGKREKKRKDYRRYKMGRKKIYKKEEGMGPHRRRRRMRGTNLLSRSD